MGKGKLKGSWALVVIMVIASVVVAAMISGENTAASGTDHAASTNASADSSAVTKICAHDAKTFRCVKYVRNYDADTITFDIPNVHPLIGDKISVRVRHVDTPEIKGKAPCEKEVARTAKRLVENLLGNARRIDLENADKDKYFRILADVIVDGQSLKDILLKNNLAYAYEGGTKQRLNWCKKAARGTAALDDTH